MSAFVLWVNVCVDYVILSFEFVVEFSDVLEADSSNCDEGRLAPFFVSDAQSFDGIGTLCSGEGADHAADGVIMFLDVR